MGVAINLAICCYARMLPLPTYGQSPYRHLPLSRRSGVVQIRRAAGGWLMTDAPSAAKRRVGSGLGKFRKVKTYAQTHSQ